MVCRFVGLWFVVCGLVVLLACGVVVCVLFERSFKELVLEFHPKRGMNHGKIMKNPSEMV